MSGIGGFPKPGGAGGGGGKTLLAAFTAAGGETAASFAGLPEGFIDLEIVMSLRGSTAASVNLRLNESVAAVYDKYRQFGGFAQGGDQQTGQTAFGDILSVNAVQFTEGRFNIFNYRKSDRWKYLHGQCAIMNGTSSSDGYVVNTGGKWRDTAAVSRLDLYLTAGNFAADSEIRLYGM